MIRNIVFDLGNVLISFDPSEYLLKKNYPEDIRSVILNEIFGSREWLMLDKGEITLNEAVESISKKSSLKREEIALVFNFRTEIMFPLDENVRMLPALKKQGFMLYYLSNFPLDIFEEIKNDYYFFRFFDGGIISSEVKLLKPDIRIFEYLMAKYSLKPAESLYIDDNEKNTNAAICTGMTGFTTYGSWKLKDDLEKLLNIRLVI